ncbi:hypothetical protein SUGI_0440720 [Cryptomeria japonica]|nr:hypothetical protein SUGI_0440720 [Cryptomeria japonica]
MDGSLCNFVKEGNCEKVRDLTHNNPQILKTLTPLENIVLHVAASRKDYKLVELLLSLKPHIVLMRNVNQETMLHKSSATGCWEVVDLLLNFKSNEVCCNSLDCCHPKAFDLEGCRLDLDDLWRAPNVDHETTLHYVARGDYVEIVRLLLEKVKGIELNMNKADMVVCLLEKRPALVAKDDTANKLPLHLASIRGNRRILEELLKIHPDTALQKKQDGMAAILYATRMDYEDIVRCLIDYGPDCTELLGKNNKNALHFALEYGNIPSGENSTVGVHGPFVFNQPR